jgi:hypothetical protein
MLTVGTLRFAPSAVIARSERDEAIQGSHDGAGSLRYRSR